MFSLNVYETEPAPFNNMLTFVFILMCNDRFASFSLKYKFSFSARMSAIYIKPSTDSNYIM